MINDLKKIEYRKNMLSKGMAPENLQVKVWQGREIPSEVRDAIKKEELLSLGGVYRDLNAGDPIEYDPLRLILSPAVAAGPARRGPDD